MFTAICHNKKISCKSPTTLSLNMRTGAVCRCVLFPERIERREKGNIILNYDVYYVMDFNNYAILLFYFTQEVLFIVMHYVFPSKVKKLYQVKNDSLFSIIS